MMNNINNENSMKNLEKDRERLSDVINIINDETVADAVFGYIVSKEKGPEEKFLDKTVINEEGAAT